MFVSLFVFVMASQPVRMYPPPAFIMGNLFYKVRSFIYLFIYLFACVFIYLFKGI